jgi:predicted ATP-dependent endonuclease of OLD family
MQIQSLYIDNYKILKNFNIEFQRSIPILIGVNGAGKSTLLEVIAQIFSDAILDNKPKFGFRLVYSLYLSKYSTGQESNANCILVELFAEKKDTKIAYKVDVRDTLNTDRVLEKKSDIEKEFGSFYKIFPSNIVIYYSGLSDIMKNICLPHDKKLSKGYRKEKVAIYRPFFYFEPILFEIILISLLSFDHGNIPNYLKEKAKIYGIQDLKIRLKRPHWAKLKLDKWWGARGEVNKFLNFLSSKIENIILEPSNDEYLTITIIGQCGLSKIREYFTEEKSLFKMLNTLYIDGFWDGVTFNFITEKNGEPKSFSILSEGEQQSITIKGLTELVASENTLFLFDEPDNYLHPSWQRNFIKGIIEFNENNHNVSSQFLISTHSPLLLSDANADKTEVKIMEDGKVIKITPQYYGRDIVTILYDMMGVEKRNKKFTECISRLFNLIEDENLEEAKQEYEELSSLLGNDDPDIVLAKTQMDYLEEDKNETDN